jgi:hypothetical protein
MTDMTERAFYHDLDTLDAAADFWAITDPATDAHAPGLDEWNALRLTQGQRPGTFGQYLREIAPNLDRAGASEPLDTVEA